MSSSNCCFLTCIQVCQEAGKVVFHLIQNSPQFVVFSTNYGFSRSHVWMWELDHKEGWVLENWCFWMVVLEKTLESPLDCKEIKAVNPKGNQPWIFFGRTDAEAEAPILWPPDVKSWLIIKDLDAGKDWRQEEKGKTEDEMVGWHHLTQWTWVWASSGRWWRTGKPGVLQSMGLQRDMTEWQNNDNTVKGFSVVNESEVDIFLECPCFFYDAIDVGILISGSSAYSKSSLYIWKFSIHVLFIEAQLEGFWALPC